MAKVNIPEGITGKAVFEFLKENKGLIIAAKKMENKHSDAIGLMSRTYIDKSGVLVKAAPETPIVVDGDTDILITRNCVINTCNYMDSHADVHIPGIWKRSLNTKKDRYLLEQHDASFRGVITGDIEAYTQVIAWKAMGYDAPGTTEALIYKALIGNKRNPFMFDQYRNDYVKQHSVGMRYHDIQMAINVPDDEYYKEEFAIWNKYIGDIVNREEAEEQGYYFAVREAAELEGSAVLFGSNDVTPVLPATGKHSPDGTADRPAEKDQNGGSEAFISWVKQKQFINS